MIRYNARIFNLKFSPTRCITAYARNGLRSASIYLCEQVFSSMKQIKDKQWSLLTGGNLKNLVILATTKLQPDVDKLEGGEAKTKDSRMLVINFLLLFIIVWF
jgi:hypothetical protein